MIVSAKTELKADCNSWELVMCDWWIQLKQNKKMTSKENNFILNDMSWGSMGISCIKCAFDPILLLTDAHTHAHMCMQVYSCMYFILCHWYSLIRDRQISTE